MTVKRPQGGIDPLVLVLPLAAIGPFLPALRNGLVWDDKVYVAGNPLFALGWRAAIAQAFRTITIGNWHPLTLLSLCFDHALGGPEPLTYHLVNLLLHAANALLVQRTIVRVTGDRVAAFGAALLWAVHPLRVESVAWISERKDLLYAMFFLLALLAYFRHASASGRIGGSYAAALGCFVASCLSKAMGVSLVPVLVLADWLLGRRGSARTLAEKVPFAIVGLVIGCVAIGAQRSADAIPLAQSGGLPARIAYACYAVVFYGVKTIAPFGLSGLYRYPVGPEGGLLPSVWASVVLTLALAAACVAAARRSRLVGFGIGTAVATIALVLQILPVGGVVAADRYTYLPGVGLSIVVAAGLARARAYARRVAIVAVVPVAIAFSAATWARCGAWRDEVVFWSSVLARDPGAAPAHQNLGVALDERGDAAGAIAHLDAAVRIGPAVPEYRFDRGLAMGDAGRWDEALADLTEAIRLKPDFAAAYMNRGLALEQMGRAAEGAPDVRRAAELGFPVDPAVSARYDSAGAAR